MSGKRFIVVSVAPCTEGTEGIRNGRCHWVPECWGCLGDGTRAELSTAQTVSSGEFTESDLYGASFVGDDGNEYSYPLGERMYGWREVEP